jgi:hypothetical protein
MNKTTFRAFLAMAAIATTTAAIGCVADRPSRNGVFNENQYLKKSFIIEPGDGSQPDPGWFLKATVLSVSTPNPLGGLGIFPGADTGFGTGLGFVRFRVTQDHLQMLNVRQISTTPSVTDTEEVVNAWPITNVDLKYQINLDGEKSNFYQENQELDWQVRQWVKINFAKNDMSDTAPLGGFVSSALAKCTDLGSSSATLVDGSFYTQEDDNNVQNNYMQWVVNITVPVLYDDATCVQSYGAEAVTTQAFGRQNVSFNLMYSMMRAKPMDDTSMNTTTNLPNDPTAYVPLQYDEKDPIRHKYGVFNIIPIERDPDTKLLAARQLANRWNPNKPITYYFSPGVPDYIYDAYKGHRIDSSCVETTGNPCARRTDAQGNTDGIEAKTNAMFASAGAKARVTFLNYNDATTYLDGAGPVRQYGDVRYSFIRWVADIDADTGWLGYGPNASDPRTGEILNGTVNMADFVGSELAYQIDFYLKSIGASYGLDYTDPANQNAWPDDGACNPGDSKPLKPATVTNTLNANDTLYAKMQEYLSLPAATYGALGPQDFVAQQDDDFFKSYWKLLPYEMYADPDMNPFVIREGGQGVFGPPAFWDEMATEVQFQKAMAQVDQGIDPTGATTGGAGLVGTSGASGLANTTAFGNQLKVWMQNDKLLETTSVYNMRQLAWDPPSAFNFVQIMAHASRHCVLAADGTTHWETKDEWVNDMLHSFYEHVSIHEFGHTLGLQHNFMGSVDVGNWPVEYQVDSMGNPVLDANGNPVPVYRTDDKGNVLKNSDGDPLPEYSLYTSSQMEYNVRGADMFNKLQWGKYDLGALGWIYSNAQTAAQTLPTSSSPHGDSISGQSLSTATTAVPFTPPWNDPNGFDAKGNEIQFLYCHHEHITYTPLCRTFDAGSTPSEIVANAIDQYEWDFNFTNYRVYRKFWNNSNYASRPSSVMTEMRRFLSQWLFDWDSTDIVNSLQRIGIKNPDANGSNLQYFTALSNKFNNELSTANRIVASFHKAIIQQSDGERPVRTVYDTYFGDVTQQGIILDKLFAMQNWVALWPSTNYNVNQAGAYISSYAEAPDDSYQYNAEDTVDSMIGGQYDAFPYFAPLAVAVFAQDTHSPSFAGRIDVRNWIGGQTFGRLQDYLDYFRQLVVANNYHYDTITMGPCVSGQTQDCATCSSISLGTDTAGNGTCTYDPRVASDTHNEFFGPDSRSYIWAYVPDRNTWVVVQKEYNSASYVIVRNYTDDVVYQLDDGAFPGGAFNNELPMKYFLDSFQQYN